MDDLEDLQASEFVTDNEDQDSLDERIESEQRLRNQQLWASFQNAACCITKLYKDRAQPNTTPTICSPWIPFQNAASNLTTLYKDCIESQRRFALLGYQVGRRKRVRDLAKTLKKHKLAAKQLQDYTAGSDLSGFKMNSCSGDQLSDIASQQHNNQEASILAVNQLSLRGCDDLPSNSMQTCQPLTQISQQSFHHQQQSLANQTSQQQHQQQQHLLQSQQSQSNPQILQSNNDDDLVTFQQALASQPAALKASNIKLNQNRRSCSGAQTGYFTSNNRATSIEHKTEEDRLLELNQFLSEEYYRHVGSRKRSCSNLGGSSLKRFRE